MRFIWIVIISLLIPASLSAQAAVTVRAKVLREVLVDFKRRAPAEVKALNDSTIAAEVASVVLRVHADVGQAVKKGDLLLELNQFDFQLNLKQAEANLASSKALLSQANAKLKRAQTLGDNKYVSADELLERETDVMVFNAQIQANEVELRNCCFLKG